MFYNVEWFYNNLHQTKHANIDFKKFPSGQYTDISVAFCNKI